MRFSVTFPGTAKQAEYLWDMLVYMRYLYQGGERVDARDTVFPTLVGLNVRSHFPGLEMDAYRLMHDGKRDMIFVGPSYRSARTDPDAFGFALHAMMHRFDREDVITFSYSIEDEKTRTSYSGGAVVADANGWERRTTESLEQKMRQEAEARIKAEAFVRDALSRGVADDEDDLRDVLEVEKKAYTVASAIGETAVTRDTVDVVAWLIENGVKSEELLPDEPALEM